MNSYCIKEKKVNPFKIAGWAIAGLILFIVALNSFTVVPAGTTKVQVCFGEVQESKFYSEGLHFPVAPYCSFDEFDTRESRYEIEGITIPTQDRFNSTGNVTVLYRIAPESVIELRSKYGNQERYIDVTMRQHLRAVVRNEGRNFKDSRELAVASNITVIQQKSLEYLQANLSGMHVSDVLIQDITFDPRIAQQILDTQVRIQREEQEKSQERIAITQAAQAEAVATGKRKARDEATRAESYQIRETASAKRFAMEEEAAGNRALSASLTSTLLRKQELDNEQVLFRNSTGNVPHTVIGTTDLRAYGIPVAPVGR